MKEIGMLHVMILAGGSGTRFWPKSRRHRPKQLLAFGDRPPLLRETVERVSGIVDAERVWVITSDRYAEEVRQMLPEVPAAQVVAEPAARDTAPAVALGVWLIQRQDPEARILVLPADHVVEPVRRFQETVQAANRLLDRSPDHLLVFGIPPRDAATGYGYIQRGEPLEVDDAGAFTVESFREKPDRQTAELYYKSGNYYWNAGMFFFEGRRMLECIQQFLPEISKGLATLDDCPDPVPPSDQLAKVYPDFPQTSIDYGVMEKCDTRLVVEASFQWDDVGSWPALARHYPPDSDGNICLGQVQSLDSSHNIVESGEGLVALIGVHDLIVVRTGDITLVCRREDAERVKELRGRLEAASDEKHL